MAAAASNPYLVDDEDDDAFGSFSSAVPTLVSATKGPTGAFDRPFPDSGVGGWVDGD